MKFLFCYLFNLLRLQSWLPGQKDIEAMLFDLRLGHFPQPINGMRGEVIKG